MQHFKRTAPPKPITRPQVDIAPTLRYLNAIQSDSQTTLAALNEKTAFLLAFAAFLRPSDLARIQLQECSVDDEDRLNLVILAPKELRSGSGRRIIKTLLIHPHPGLPALCPVAAFKALRDHPQAQSRVPSQLFVNSVSPSKPLKVTTISTWLRRLLRLSTSMNPLPSIRSLASDLALKRGIPTEDVVIMGNWSSDSVFDNHYRRQRQQSSNITAAVLQTVATL